jgi:hypothetical protein
MRKRRTGEMKSRLRTPPLKPQRLRSRDLPLHQSGDAPTPPEMVSEIHETEVRCLSRHERITNSTMDGVSESYDNAAATNCNSKNYWTAVGGSVLAPIEDFCKLYKLPDWGRCKEESSVPDPTEFVSNAEMRSTRRGISAGEPGERRR